MSDSELEERVAAAISDQRQRDRYGSVMTPWLDSAMADSFRREQIVLARAAISEVHRWRPLDDHAMALGPIMLGWAGTGFEPDKGFWDSTTQSWGYLTNEMAFEPFHRPPTHWQPLPAPPKL